MQTVNVWSETQGCYVEVEVGGPHPDFPPGPDNCVGVPSTVKPAPGEPTEPEPVVERADGSQHALGPNGLPCVAPDLAKCPADPVPVDKGDIVWTEDTKPHEICNPLAESYAIRSDTGWIDATDPANWQDGGASEGYPHQGPVVTYAITNPDIHRPLTPKLQVINEAIARTAPGVAFGVANQGQIDCGDGAGLSSVQAGASAVAVNYNTVSLNSGDLLDANTITDRAIRVAEGCCPPIPPGGSIDVAIQSALLLNINDIQTSGNLDASDASLARARSFTYLRYCGRSL